MSWISAEQAWTLLRTLPVATLAERTGGAPLLVLAPHPDDETLGCGGLIAIACATGQDVFVLVLTDGTGSHPRSAAYPASKLADLRQQESRRAAAALGLHADRVAFLGLPDTRSPHAGQAAEQAAQAIARHASACGARTIFTTWRHDPHGDHGSASKLGAFAAALTGAALFEYPVWGWTLPAEQMLQSGAVRGFRLNVGAYAGAKRQAIACHRSQLGQVIEDDPEGFTMAQHFVELFTGEYETFIESEGLLF